ncbi:cation:dicarboxylase symporter family transporter [Bradyrhizobium septentrionale]|nr:cation:dicarboxylase symporter family transporter [Bradyrhizobium septentrionale]UGY29632.1 cation:dicarboxylase symporter family transporter [Bradyrhizobium septentrionale]
MLGPIALCSGFSIWKFLVYIKEEILIVLGTSSSDPVLPSLMKKLQRLGCSKPVVGLVVPTAKSSTPTARRSSEHPVVAIDRARESSILGIS